jgi:predicted nucleic acid-binding protein
VTAEAKLLLEFFCSARSAQDREETIGDLRAAFGWVPVHDRAYARAWEVQGDLTVRGEHRGAGPVDLVVAATAELFGLTLLHHDRDFATIAGVTGQALRWYGPDLGRTISRVFVRSFQRPAPWT